MGLNRFPLILYDFSKNSKVHKYYKFYIQSLRLSPDEIRKVQNEKLARLLKEAYRHSPYYHQLFESNNLTPDSIKSIDDLPKIPPLTRKDLTESKEILLSTDKDKSIFIKKASSGTTGVPVEYYKDVESFSAGTAAGYFSWYLSGWDFGKKRINVWGNANSIKNWKSPGSRIKRQLFKQMNLPSTYFNDSQNFRSIAKQINDFKPFCISGYTSSIYSFSRYCLEHNIHVEKCNGIYTTAENLMESHKEVIEKVLGPVSDTYGCGEINGIAAQGLNTNKYFIIEPHVIVENDSVGNKGLSEAIVTDLDNSLMPFIRYKVGDLISKVKTNNNKKIPFGYFDKVYGRTVDLIHLPNEKVLSPINFLGGTMFRELGGITQHKVTWDEKILTFLFVVNDSFDPKLVNSKLQKELKEYEISFEVKIVDQLPVSKSGKFKYFEIVENKD